ncbi:CehA/McbA family metallohydrolase [Dyella caseinilytica]|uniref:CehA/McbA family metallohydrolase n=1 Tax=Dyella caseinilytica TaxID=1849581 RepID=A0ABX7GS48_9GAMM|nr:CehA/McbA family metallohydrolase [Dyella caseinilytica]QRN53114.1 CehA/McbA family metallohydrolase [Dyella caseinilytica]GGA11591.1 phosphoesterase [Dyella caseinilytica]
MKTRVRLGSIPFLVLMILFLWSTSVVHADDTAPNLTLKGQIHSQDNHTYRPVVFDVPANVNRITIQFAYTGRDQRTTIDLGLLGPDGFHGQDGFRGWSGGSKQIFTISATDATPSFLPGAIRPGRWTLLLGIPNIRPNVTADYTAKIWFGHPGDPAWLPEVLNPPLRKEAGWYRGDLHMHGAHSDGTCASQSGKQRVPCPLYLTIDAALQRGLDFIALSDHNAVSQANDIRELQPYYDQLLLMPAREFTTFTGHANLFGSDEPVDFRVGSASVPDWNTLLREAAALHGLISINHPLLADDEGCMGCGWASAKPVDMHLVQAIEAVNGVDAMLPTSGIPFWQHLLDQGYRLTGVGGSDNHDAKQVVGNLVGTPTTVVHASELSMPAILAGIRAGHVFIDVQGTRDRFLDLTASAGHETAEMGDAMTVPSGQYTRLTVKASAPEGSRVEMIVDGKPWQPDANLAVHGSLTQSFSWPSDGKRHWIRANVRGAAGELLLVGNPVYIN